MVPRYIFNISITAEAETPEEAWNEAWEAFALDPGLCPDEFEIEETGGE